MSSASNLPGFGGGAEMRCPCGPGRGALVAALSSQCRTCLWGLQRWEAALNKCPRTVLSASIAQRRENCCEDQQGHQACPRTVFSCWMHALAVTLSLLNKITFFFFFKQRAGVVFPVLALVEFCVGIVTVL